MALAFWMLPAAWSGMIDMIQMVVHIDDIRVVYFDSPYGYIVSELAESALIVTAVLMLILCLSWWVAVNLGTWVGVRWPRAARLLAAAGMIAGIGIVYGAVWIIDPLVYGRIWLNVLVLRSRIVAVGVLVLLLIAGKYIYNDAIIYLEDHAPAQ